MPRQKKQGKKPVTRVSVEGKLREEIDLDRYAWALLQCARRKLEADEANQP